MWALATNKKEIHAILNGKKVLIDWTPVTDPGHIVGPMDVVSIPTMSKHYRILPWQGRRGLAVREIDEQHAKWKLLIVENKTIVRGGDIQVNCSYGVNFLLRKESKYQSKFDDPKTFVTRGSVKYDLTENKVLDYFPLHEGCTVLVTSGVNTGRWGYLQAFEKRIGKNRSIASIKTLDGSVFITALENIVVIGSKEPVIQEYQKDISAAA